ncbi:MAG TPA: GNAT family protein [Pseudonocardia sp.]|nr:GNAT family protein [Pseudonocardia sp.]
MSGPPGPAREPGVVLRPISPEAAAALVAGRAPSDVAVAPDHPTEFSAQVARHVDGAEGGQRLGPFFIHRGDDEVVVGEIGAARTAPGTFEIGYAVVASCQGRGYATAAVRALVALVRTVPGIERVVAHTPVDRPASARVLAKAGFTPSGERTEEHDGATLRVLRWELALGGTDG